MKNKYKVGDKVFFVVNRNWMLPLTGVILKIEKIYDKNSSISNMNYIIRSFDDNKKFHVAECYERNSVFYIADKIPDDREIMQVLRNKKKIGEKIIRESVIETKVCAYAISKGWKVYKFTSPGNRAVPDRIFIKQGFVGMIEFKQEGKKPTKLQEKVIKDLRNEKIPVSVVDSVELGKEIIDFWDQLETC